MSDAARQILDDLSQVRQLREARTADLALGLRIHAIKEYQHQRFTQTYQDALQDTDCSSAAQFFLDEIYGPTDFERRDTEFARVVPALVRLFPVAIVETVQALIRLHLLSESLDDAMGAALTSTSCSETQYQTAWRRVGREPERRLQVDLIARVGRAMSWHTRSKVLRHSLRAMRGPATVAGLATLQQFLERGFVTFGRLPDAQAFINMIVERESELITRLFGAKRPQILREPFRVLSGGCSINAAHKGKHSTVSSRVLPVN